MNKNVYGSVVLFGSIFALLEFLVADNHRMAFTIILATIFAISGIYLFTEWRFYHQHQAMIASFQFLVIPIFLLLVGNILAPLGLNEVIINLNLELFGLSIMARSTLTSISLVVPIFIVLSLTARYYDGRFPGFVIQRRTFGNVTLPLLIHLISLILLFLEGGIFGYLDFLVFVFIILSIIQIFAKLAYPLLKSFRRSSTSTSYSTERRGFINSILGRNGSRTPRRRRTTHSSRPSRRSDQSRRTGPVSTTPSDGYRQIPLRSRTSNQTRRVSSRTTPSRSQQKSAEISKGVEAVTPSKPARKVASSRIKSYLPKGKFSKDDLKCMVCYEEFNGKRGSNVLICPHCKFPAHEIELRSWLNQSNICPRCSRKIANKSFGSSLTISERQYSSVIKGL